MGVSRHTYGRVRGAGALGRGGRRGGGGAAASVGTCSCASGGSETRTISGSHQDGPAGGNGGEGGKAGGQAAGAVSVSARFVIVARQRYRISELTIMFSRGTRVGGHGQRGGSNSAEEATEVGRQRAGQKSDIEESIIRRSDGLFE